MKITKRQLRRIIKEELGRAGLDEMLDVPPEEQHDVGYKDWVSPELPSQEDDDYEDDEYERGYQDGLDGIPPTGRGTNAYDAGYEDGSSDLHLPVPIEAYMGPDPGPDPTPEEVAENERLMQRQEPWKHN
jgi:hypothetical protein